MHGSQRDKRGRFVKGMNPWNKGKHLSEEHKDNLRHARLAYFLRHPSAPQQWGKKIQKVWEEHPAFRKKLDEKIRKTTKAASFRKRMSAMKKAFYRERAGKLK